MKRQRSGGVVKQGGKAAKRQGGVEGKRRAGKSGKRGQGGRKHSRRGSAPLSAVRSAASRRDRLAGLKGQDGCGALVAVFERCGKQEDYAQKDWAYPTTAQLARTKGAAASLGRATARACQAFAAVGHAQRAKIMAKLLEGPATYRSLQRLTKLKAGPLYHHINQLRLAGLILPKQRDLYELTRGGRNLVVAAGLLAPLVADKRRRPIAS